MRMSTRIRGVAATVLIVAAATTNVVMSADEGSAGGRKCATRTLGVSLARDRPVNQVVVMQHCIPRGRAEPRSVDMFSDGATYTRYWDWPEPQSEYSVVDKVLAGGKATLTYDRLGTGRSSQLPSTAVTLDVDVWVVEQIVRWLTRQGYSRVVHWVHSYAAAVGIQHAATPGMSAVDRLVVTGFLHTQRNPVVAGRTYAANQDHPRWRDLDGACSEPGAAGSGCHGWLTTRPGTRGLSYHGPNARAAVIRMDERRKTVVSSTAMGAYAAQQSAAADRNLAGLVKVPVTIVIGSHDAIFCWSFDCSDPAAVAALEAPYFRAAPSVRVVVAQAGHSFALDPSVARTYQAVTGGGGGRGTTSATALRCPKSASAGGRTVACAPITATYHDKAMTLPGVLANWCSSCHVRALTPIPVRRGLGPPRMT